LFLSAITEWPSESDPLTLFIDSVDQLDTQMPGVILDWLPMQNLPPFVRLVISTLPNYNQQFQCCSFLRQNVGSCNVVQVPMISEHSEVLESILQRQGCQLTEEQGEAIAQPFQASGFSLTPLWLTIVTQTVALGLHMTP